MKKEYITPASQLRMVAVQQMISISIQEDEDGNPINAQQGAGDGDSDGLVKAETNLWDNEW